MQKCETYDEYALCAGAITSFFNLHRGAKLIKADAKDSRLKRPYPVDVSVDDQTITYKIRSQKIRQFVTAELCLRASELPSWDFDLWKQFCRREVYRCTRVILIFYSRVTEV